MPSINDFLDGLAASGPFALERLGRRARTFCAKKSLHVLLAVSTNPGRGLICPFDGKEYLFTDDGEGTLGRDGPYRFGRRIEVAAEHLAEKDCGGILVEIMEDVSLHLVKDIFSFSFLLPPYKRKPGTYAVSADARIVRAAGPADSPAHDPRSTIFNINVSWYAYAPAGSG